MLFQWQRACGWRLISSFEIKTSGGIRNSTRLTFKFERWADNHVIDSWGRIYLRMMSAIQYLAFKLAGIVFQLRRRRRRHISTVSLALTINILSGSLERQRTSLARAIG